MKVYIITSGEYSDYMIECVFLDKDKAYKFADTRNLCVEEYNTVDDGIEVDYKRQIKEMWFFEIYNNVISVNPTGKLMYENTFTIDRGGIGKYDDYCGGFITTKLNLTNDLEKEKEREKKTIAEKVAKKKAELLGL